MSDTRDPAPSPVLSPAQRNALAQLCEIHERGLSPRRFSRRSLLLAFYIILTLGFAVLLLNMTAFAAPGYLMLGFVVGALLKDLNLLMVFRRIWPVYEIVIDWPRAFSLLKASAGSADVGEAHHDAEPRAATVPGRHVN